MGINNVATANGQVSRNFFNSFFIIKNYNKKPAVGRVFCFHFELFYLNNADDLLAGDGVVEVDLALGAKLDDAFLEGKESVVRSHTNVLAGHNISTTLAYDNRADES